MPATPRTVAIFWTVAFILDLTSLGILTASMVIHPDHRNWFLILLLVFMVLAALSAGYSSWRWWRMHRIRTQASIPLYGAPPPAVAAR
ncbi:hypothetical protein B0H11DRAFT_2058886 [Mycena galericulata]|nr:hypothetical protein B0H11DRAFT_2058886 [Mycena galericulata]